MNFPGLAAAGHPGHQGAVTVSASPTVVQQASAASTVPVATPVVDTYLSQGIGPISGVGFGLLGGSKYLKLKPNFNFRYLGLG